MPVRRAGLLASYPAKVENGAKRGLILAGEVVVQVARRKSPIDTGRLKRSLTVGRPRTTRRFRWAIDIGSNVEYAPAQEFGSGIFAEGGKGKMIIIRAKNKQALAFNWENAPAGVAATQALFPLVFFKSVQSRGVRAQPYLRPALRESTAVVKVVILTSIVGSVTKT